MEAKRSKKVRAHLDESFHAVGWFHLRASCAAEMDTIVLRPGLKQESFWDDVGVLEAQCKIT